LGFKVLGVGGRWGQPTYKLPEYDESLPEAICMRAFSYQNLALPPLSKPVAAAWNTRGFSYIAEALPPDFRL
jgi:hypothetical protein